MTTLARAIAVVLLLLGAFVASPAPVITSVTPNTSTVNGGIHVTIKGDGFSYCVICSPPVPPGVLFGFVPATAVTLVDAQTLDAVAPAHLPGTVDVLVYQNSSTVALRDAFTFTGDISEGFETILLPIFSPPVHGALGSEFHTVVRAWARGDETVPIYGMDTKCGIIDPPFLRDDPYLLRGELLLSTDCSNWPARFLFVPKASSSRITFGDRVLDVSRSALSNGTEIPIVRSSRFTIGPVKLLGVPVDARYRTTLRIYSTAPTTAQVSVKGRQPEQVTLQAGPSIFEPAYGTFSDFPIPVGPGSEGTLSVTVEGALSVNPGTGTISPGPPIWAFITVTNNATQEITTITPDLP